MSELDPVVVGDADHCRQCGHEIGRAGRSDEELLAALHAGTFRTAFGVVDYSVSPPTMTYYCGSCRRDSR